MLPVDNEQQGPGDHEEHVERQQNYPRRNTICMLMVGHSENTQVAGFMHDFIKYSIRNFVVVRPLRPAPKMLNVEILNCSLV